MTPRCVFFFGGRAPSVLGRSPRRVRVMRRRAQPRGPIFGRAARAVSLGAGGMWAYGIAVLLTIVATGFTAVCHELRTPLGAISSWAELIRRGTIPPERLPHAAEVILRNVKLLARITQDLVDLSRMALGTLSLRREPLDPGQLVSDCVASARESAVQKGVVIEEALRPVGQMLADRERLSQVVGNVLNNAIRFTPAGGEVHVRLRGEGRRAVLTVTDTGGGIPPHLLPRIFEPGMRHAGSEGFGLGLTIAKDIVEHHGGTISAHSEGEGLGASFTIVLPVG